MNTSGKRGITLIMVAAVLAVLAALATGFYTMMLSQSRAAISYSDSVRADLLAKGGVDYAIARLRAQCYAKTEDPTDPWYSVHYLTGANKTISFASPDPNNPLLPAPYTASVGNTAGNFSDRFSIQVADAASKINVNACDNLAVMLDNLCRVIGPPLVPAGQTRLTQRVWEWYGGTSYNTDTFDWPVSGTPNVAPYGDVPRDIYYWLYDKSGSVVWQNGQWVTGVTPAQQQQARPLVDASGRAVFGDGYAIAGYRSLHGRFKRLDDVRQALTFLDRNGNGVPDNPLEMMEIEVKFAALKDYITVDSWVDTDTVCVGKFEWANTYSTSPPAPLLPAPNGYSIAIDRDKSWIADDPLGDPNNERGSLRGSYVSILNGHGAGQLRRILTNGIDWIQVDNGFTINPGPASSYMIVAQEDAVLVDVAGQPIVRPGGVGSYPGGTTCFPKTNTDGTLADDPGIDYAQRPLCIHRSPVNINTVSDKVLASLFLGINVTQGHFLSVGTQTDMAQLAQFNPKTGKLKSRWTWQAAATSTSAPPDWYIDDYDDPTVIPPSPYRTVEPYIITPYGLKRIPADQGQVNYDVDYNTVVKPNLPAGYDMQYLNNYGQLDPNAPSTMMNEGNELAYRIIIAREYDKNYPYFNPWTGAPLAAGNAAYFRGPIRSWDDLYFRVVKPWDDLRQARSVDGNGVQHKASVARLIMAAFNSNPDILKFNPNIEWIDRWGRNFTQMEPVMVYTNTPESDMGTSRGHGQIDTNNAKVNDIVPANALNANAVPVFVRERRADQGLVFSIGPYGVDPQWQGAYVVRSFRYRSDEMIDKTDLNRSTTEMSFDSGGIFEIQSLGQVVKSNNVLAERKVGALAKVYSVWRETTQRQFAQGQISQAAGARGTATAGTIARDATPANDGSNTDYRLALTTLPEPLVPLKYTINNPKNFEIVDTTISATTNKRNAWGQEVPISTPLIVANKVIPAGYDGQIVLATNTQRFDPSGTGSELGQDMDTFLASFNGDLDTETCNGNGHEQAKTPLDQKVQVMDCIGLLGALDDNQIDADPGLRNNNPANYPNPPGATVTADLPPYGSTSPMSLLHFVTAAGALRGLDPNLYWNNCTCRQGDLRADGAFVGGPGVSGNDGVLKYLCGNDNPTNYANQNFNLNGAGATYAAWDNVAGDSGTVQGWLVSMWTKPTWHHSDNRHHEFFDASNPGNRNRAEAFFLRKMGMNNYAASEAWSDQDGDTLIGITGPTTELTGNSENSTWGLSGCANRNNDFAFCSEDMQDGWGDWTDPDWLVYMHGGVSGVPKTRASQPESPSYRVQPFRWQFLGGRLFLKKDFSKCTNGAAPRATANYIPSGWDQGKRGFWKPNGGWDDSDTRWIAENLKRPFIDTERFPEGTNYNSDAKFWSVSQSQGCTGFVRYQDKGRAGGLASDGQTGQDVRWDWAQPGGTNCNTEAAVGSGNIHNYKIFGMNNCNYWTAYGWNLSIYRHVTEEGTYAVIDEFKISRKETMLRNPPVPADDRITRPGGAGIPEGEQGMSRYYLPANPADSTQCPTFTSQTLLQSTKGFDKLSSLAGEQVVLARVSWTGFTPRFMSEYKTPENVAAIARPRFVWTETITKATAGLYQVPFKGPFNYCIYNNLAGYNNASAESFKGTSAIPGVGALNPEVYEDFGYIDPASGKDFYSTVPNVLPYRCDRPTPDKYPASGTWPAGQSQSTRGLEIEIMGDAGTPLTGSAETLPGSGTFNTTSVFTNPDTVNRFGNENTYVTAHTDKLRYRVRFRYPVDPLADPYAASPWTDPVKHYLLDTPVFDDIAVTYFTKPRVLDYREITE